MISDTFHIRVVTKQVVVLEQRIKKWKDFFYLIEKKNEIIKNVIYTNLLLLY